MIQGSQDKVARPLCTARLMHRLPNGVKYREVNTAHDLLDPGSNGWNQVKDLLLVFAESIREQIPTNRDSFVSDSVVDPKSC